MNDQIVCRKLRINGTVQGVGFRPFVYVLACEENLTGTVLNDGQGVETVLEGTEEQIEKFLKRLYSELPPLAKIDNVVIENMLPLGFDNFAILKSQSTSVNTGIPADAAVCRACLQELTDQKNRRYRYAFINCTHCGPRYTITEHLPYDRPQTSMKYFPMCDSCLAEYTDPMDRRFHAQPNACPKCGPHLELLDKNGVPITCEDEIAELYARIKDGQIAAVKGLGGFHLVCDAKNSLTVSRLRKLKTRPSKPFAVMALNALSGREFVTISEQAEKELTSPAAPIVLCPKLPVANLKMPEIAPGLGSIGLMLPYTPIHWLLFFEAAGRPVDPTWMDKLSDLVLIMTSGNYGGEPIVIDNDEAVKSLKGICDCFLVHNRRILVRCDDSVYRMFGNESPRPIRRARGHTPAPFTLAQSCPEICATGAWLKNTACVAKGNKAIVSQHIGDLDRATNCRTLKRAIEHLSEVFEVKPQIVACDMHPDFYSTQLAEELAEEFEAELLPVQHHHAHIASVMAQHGLSEPVIGLSLDGVGYGTDGTAWGGELLLVRPEGFERVGHLKEVLLPGADKCAREGWRIALALLQNQEKIIKEFPYSAAPQVKAMLDSDLPIPKSSSLGRMFDAAASLLGVANVSTYEGEAPALLEAAAEAQIGAVQESLFAIEDDVLDILPLVLSMAERQDIKQASADFHSTLAYCLSMWAKRAAERLNIRKVCLSGGCCLNVLLSSQLKNNLEKTGLEVFESIHFPCNDGGISLGQAWVAAMKYNLKKD